MSFISPFHTATSRPRKPVRNTRMKKTVNYVLNCRDTAETCLEDGRCSFTNNLSENEIRVFAVNRKNWLFSNSVDGPMPMQWSTQWLKWQRYIIWIYTDAWNFYWSIGPQKKLRTNSSQNLHPGVKTPVYQKSHMNYSELLQLAKGWSDFIFYRIIFWRVLLNLPPLILQKKFHTLVNAK